VCVWAVYLIASASGSGLNIEWAEVPIFIGEVALSPLFFPGTGNA